jgi:hypothetical protein
LKSRSQASTGALVAPGAGGAALASCGRDDLHRGSLDAGRARGRKAPCAWRQFAVGSAVARIHWASAKRAAAALARGQLPTSRPRLQEGGGADERYRPVRSTRQAWHRVSGGSAEDGTGRWTRRGTRSASPRSTGNRSEPVSRSGPSTWVTMVITLAQVCAKPGGSMLQAVGS